MSLKGFWLNLLVGCPCLMGAIIYLFLGESESGKSTLLKQMRWVQIRESFYHWGPMKLVRPLVFVM